MSEKISVSEAVDRRMSVRAFTDDAVAPEIIREILDLARRAPSGGNVQPWRVDVLSGEAMTRFKAIVAEKVMTAGQEAPQYEIYPKGLWEPHRSYRFKVGEDMYGLVGVAREDKMGRLAWLAENYKFFGAPVGLFFSIDKKFGPPQWSDLGMLMQTIMLLAIERGIDTCAQESWSYFPDTVRSFCGLGDEMIVFSGMAIGYRDDSHPVNKLRSDRAAVDDFATFHG